jgi:hypothetical protein
MFGDLNNKSQILVLASLAFLKEKSYTISRKKLNKKRLPTFILAFPKLACK